MNTPPDNLETVVNNYESNSISDLDNLDDRTEQVLEKQRTNFYRISLATGEGRKDLTANDLLFLDNVSTLRLDQAEAIVQAIHSVDPIDDWTKVFKLEDVSETNLDIIQKYLLERGVQFVCSPEGEARVGLEPLLRYKIGNDLVALDIDSLNLQLDILLDTLFGGVQTYQEVRFTIPLVGTTKEQQQSLLKYFRKMGLFTEIYIIDENEIDLFINLAP
jgi:hypothetical protein